MINFMSNLAVFGFNDIPGSDAVDTLNEMDYQVNENIMIVSSYYGTQSKNRGKYLEAQTSMNVKDGDLLVMISSYLKGSHHEPPKKFHEIISQDTGRKMGMSVSMKIWRDGDPMDYLIERTSKYMYTSLITIRGAKDVVDGKIVVCKDDLSESVAPRVKTEAGGALLSAFSFKDERNMSVMTQKNLVSIADKDGGLAVGVCSCDGGISKKIRGMGSGINSSDIAVAISLI